MIEVDLTPQDGPQRPPAMQNQVRALVAALVIALIAGPLVGFAIGRTSGTSQVARSAPPADSTTSSTASATAAPSTGTTIYDGTTVAPAESRTSGVKDGPTAIGGTLNMTLIDTHQQGDYMVRLYDQATAPGSCGQNWCPAAMCFRQSAIEVSSAAIAQAAYFPRPGIEAGSTVRVRPEGVDLVGIAEGLPTVVVLLSTAPSVNRVAVEIPGVGKGEADATHGVAAVVFAIANQDVPAMYTAIQASMNITIWGTEFGTETRSGVPRYPDVNPACVPPPPAPPTLPEPISAGPADPVAAKAAVNDAFAGAFGGGDIQATQRLVENGDVLKDVMAAARKAFPDAVKTSRAEVTDLVFLDDHTAAVIFVVKYELGIQSLTSQIGPYLGYARLINSTWVVAQETFCGVIAIAASCPQPVK